MPPAPRTPAPVWQPHPAFTAHRRDGAQFMPALGLTAGAQTDVRDIDGADTHGSAGHAGHAHTPRFIADPLAGAVQRAAARPTQDDPPPVAPPGAASLSKPVTAPAPQAVTEPAIEFTPEPPRPAPAPAPAARPREPEPAHDPHAAEQARAAALAAATAAASAAAARQQQLDTAVLHALDRAAATPPAWQADDLASLALHLAMQLVRGELRHGPHAIDRLARGALQLLDDARGDAVVDLHPDDLAQAREAGQSWPRHPVLRPDASLSRGSVRVRVGAAEVEDLIEQRLQALADALLAPPEATADAGAAGDADLDTFPPADSLPAPAA